MATTSVECPSGPSSDSSTATPESLRDFDQALDSLPEDSEPVHVLRLGEQVDIQGIIADEDNADRRVRYLTKYLSKSIGDSMADAQDRTRRQRTHLAGLNEHVPWLPCSPTCANWLRYGLQPRQAKASMIPGQCSAKAHQPEQVGCGGRRVLVSRLWTGKTLKHHKADRAAVVREVLEAGVDAPELERLSVAVKRDDGTQGFHWTIHHPDDSTTPLYRTVMTRAIGQQMQWRAGYQDAKRRAGPAHHSSRLPDSQPAP